MESTQSWVSGKTIEQYMLLYDGHVRRSCSTEMLSPRFQTPSFRRRLAYSCPTSQSSGIAMLMRDNELILVIPGRL